MANYDIRETLSGPALAAHLAIGELAGGNTDGANKAFTTAHPIYNDSIDVYVGSQGGFSYMGQGATLDYTVTGSNQITFTVPPPRGSVVIVDYIRP